MEMVFESGCENDYDNDYQGDGGGDDEEEEEQEQNYQYDEEQDNDGDDDEEDEDLPVEDIPSKVLKQYFNEFNKFNWNAHLEHRGDTGSASYFSLLFPISDLLIDPERLLALGLQADQFLRIEFIVLMTNKKGTITVRNILHYDPITDKRSDLELEWLLKLRFTEYVKELVFDFQVNFNLQSSLINEVINNTGCSSIEARRVLELSKWDVNDAVIHLMDTQTKPTSESDQNNNFVIDLTLDIDDDVTQRDLFELREIFSCVEADTLLNIYQSTNNSFADTVNILQSNEFNPLMYIPNKQESTYANNTTELLNVIIRETHHNSLHRIDISNPNKFIVLFLLIEGEILTCGSRCLICNQRLSYPGILPAICGRNLCVMGYEELGVGIDLQREILKNPLIIDLFISFLYSAVFSQKKRLALKFPSSIRVFDSDNFERTFMLQSPDGLLSNNYALLEDVVTLIPSVNQMAEWCQLKELKEKLDQIHILIYPLILWLVQSNRSYLRMLAPEEVPQGIRAKCVFALTSGPMEKEISFQKLRHESSIPVLEPPTSIPVSTDPAAASIPAPVPAPVPGSVQSKGPSISTKSFFVYHGSSLENWHSILRGGLRNLSLTEYMSHGAAHGSGVYFSPRLSVSSRYASTSKIWQHSEIIKSTDCCLAICEIINRPADIKFHGDIFVVKKEEHIAPRFLLITPSKDCVQNSLELNYEGMINTLKSQHKK